MSTNSFVRQVGCGHSDPTGHGPDLERLRPLCMDCYHAKEDKIYDRYSTPIYKARESDLAAATAALEAEAGKPVEGSWTGKIQNFMTVSSGFVLKNVAAVERERDKEVAKLWKEVAT